MYWDKQRRAYFTGMRPVALVTVIVLAIAFTMAAVTQIDLTTQVKGILATANGGTGSAFFGISGPTAARTYTLPDASATILTSNAAVTVPQGGTGVATLAAHGNLIGNGTGTVVVSSAGSSGQCWMSNGASADPTWQPCPGGGSFAANETPTGTVNGVNATFTLASTPNPAASLQLYKNGQLMLPGGVDYTLTTNSIAYVAGAIPKTGDVHVAFYRF